MGSPSGYDFRRVLESIMNLSEPEAILELTKVAIMLPNRSYLPFQSCIHVFSSVICTYLSLDTIFRRSVRRAPQFATLKCIRTPSSLPASEREFRRRFHILAKMWSIELGCFRLSEAFGASRHPFSLVS